ncbi:MAG: glutamate 5-kinase [bacterium]
MQKKKIVIKIGTNVITNEVGNLDLNVIKHIAEQVSIVRNRNYEVILVTSGAVGAGRVLFDKNNKEETVSDKQVYAAVGQVSLINTYTKYFKKYKVGCAQILVTREDFRDKVHYENMENCFLNVLKRDVLPIVNENDIVAIKELLFTDNDELMGLVALQLKADIVIVLTSVEGLINGDPKDKNAEVVSEIKIKDLKNAKKYITKDKTTLGKGGMFSKFNIAEKLVENGVTVFLANGKRKNVITDIITGKKVGTRFTPK